MKVSMNRTQAGVSDWAESIFIADKAHDELSIAAHLLSEAMAVYMAAGGELSMAQSIVSTEWMKGPRKHDELPVKTADVAILAFTMAGYMRFSLYVQVRAKMALNRIRKWGRRGLLGFAEHTNAPTTPSQTAYAIATRQRILPQPNSIYPTEGGEVWGNKVVSEGKESAYGPVEEKN